MSGKKQQQQQQQRKYKRFSKTIEVPLVTRRRIGALIRSFATVKERIPSASQDQLRIHWAEDDDWPSKHPSVDPAYFLGAAGTVTITSVRKSTTDSAAQAVEQQVLNMFY
jgi:hypothetical protein